MEKERITAYLTKRALTAGIEKVEGEVCHDISSEMLSYGDNYAHGNGWHRTYEAAVARAEAMRSAKIAALGTKIARLERLTFGPELD